MLVLMCLSHETPCTRGHGCMNDEMLQTSGISHLGLAVAAAMAWLNAGREWSIHMERLRCSAPNGPPASATPYDLRGVRQQDMSQVSLASEMAAHMRQAARAGRAQ
jgi:hypothetical protein